MKRLRIAVIDGKGGGLGKAVCERLQKYKVHNIEVLALGTNSFATTAMLKAGAMDGATGENAICHMAMQVDLIIGPMAILVANSMMGEISPQMAGCIAASPAHKLLLPLQKCNMSVVGVKELTMTGMLDELEHDIVKRIS